MELHPPLHVIILTAPAPELVGVAVDPQKMILQQGGHPPKVGRVGQLVRELIQGHRHVPRLLGAGVHVPVIIRQHVHVMEDGACPVEVRHRLDKANIHERPPVERQVIRLVESCSGFDPVS